MRQLLHPCPICDGRKDTGRVSLRSRFRDVSGDRWALTALGAQLLADERAAEARLWAEQTAPYTCALCAKPMDPPPDHDPNNLLVCWDCYVETGGTTDA
jgi:hypothetical protein